MTDFLTPFEQEALLLSLKVSLWAIGVSLPFGLALAYVLSRCHFWGKGFVEAFLHLPLVLPPVAMGYLLLLSFGRSGFMGKFLYETFGISIVFTWKGAVLASAIMAFPLMVRAMKLSFDAVDTRLECAAQTLGAGSWRVFYSITLPLAFPGIVTGMLLAFARNLGEFGATITFVSNIPGQTQTLPLALYTLTQSPGGEQAALRLCFIAIGIALCSLWGAQLLERCFTARLGRK